MERCHLLIRGANLIDGTGAPARPGDIAIEGDRIAGIGDLSGWQADEVVEAAGLAVAPGFIDDHTHDDSAVLTTPDMAMKVSQGVTSVIAGNCGISLAPLSPETPLPPPFPLLGRDSEFRYPTIASYARALEEAPPALNIGLLTGHGNLRVAAMGEDLERPANAAEIADMGRRLAVALDDGSLGLSTGLGYPNCWGATTDELVGLAKHMRGKANALFCSHMRDESDQVMEAVEETLEIGRRAEAAVVISHHKCSGKSSFGRSRETLALIEAAAQSQAVGLDVYPYIASSTVLMAEYIAEGRGRHGDLFRPAPGDGRPAPGGDRRRMGLLRARGGRAPGARRGDLLVDGRGRRGAHHGLSAHHDRPPTACPARPIPTRASGAPSPGS